MMNDTIRSILGRRSVRAYTAAPVEKEKLAAIIECGQFAPSAMNRQPWHFTVITARPALDRISAENRKHMLNSPLERMRKAAEDPAFDSFRGAPAAIIASGETSAVFAPADCANAMENMALAAYSLGLGSCYIASFKAALETPEGAHLLEELGIPRGYAPLYALALGYESEVLGERAARKENAVNWVE